MREVLLKTESISHSYHKKEVLSDISISFSRGELVALLGINGAGKTTLMNILTGIIMPNKGKVLIYDTNFDNTGIRKHIGYLSETNPLYQDMYVREYLMYIGQLYLNKKQAKERVDFLIECTGLKSDYGKRIEALSKGNKQRVGLAQALVHDPAILILDEPSNGFDPHQQEEMNALLLELKEKKAIVLSTHHLNEVSDIADRYMILNDRKMIYDDCPNDSSTIETIFYNSTR